MGLISDYLEYRRLKKYYKRLIIWEHQMMEAGLPSIPPDLIPEQKGNEMNTKQARYLHRMLDRLAEGKSLYPHEIEDLRKSLPKPPAQKTLEELRREVYDVWAGTNGNKWPHIVHGDLETWLVELYDQLKGLEPTHPEFLSTEADYAAAPEGTIVAQPAMRSWFKEDDDHWSCGDGAGDDHSMFTTGTHRVLRWGKE